MAKFVLVEVILYNFELHYPLSERFSLDVYILKLLANPLDYSLVVLPGRIQFADVCLGLSYQTVLQVDELFCWADLAILVDQESEL